MKKRSPKIKKTPHTPKEREKKKILVMKGRLLLFIVAVVERL